MIHEKDWKRNKEDGGPQFEQFSPCYQAVCNWCREMSDCFELPEERKLWVRKHKCHVVKDV